MSSGSLLDGALGPPLDRRATSNAVDALAPNRKHERPCSWIAAGPPMALVLVACAGCYSPNAYGRAQLVPKGELRGVGGVEVFAPLDTDFWSIAPVIGFRWGIADGVDFGTRIGGVMQADLRLGLIDSKPFKLTIATTLWWAWVQWAFLNGGGWPPAAGAELVLLADIALSDATMLVLHGGVGYGVGYETFWHAGMGLHLRVGNGIAVQPEVSMIGRDLFGSQRNLGLAIGVGVSRDL